MTPQQRYVRYILAVRRLERELGRPATGGEKTALKEFSGVVRPVTRMEVVR